MFAKRRRNNAREAEALELGYLAEVLAQLERRAADCELRLARVEQQPPGAAETNEGRLLRERANAAVLRSKLARVRLATSLVESYTEMRREELAAPVQRKPTTTMEVP
jgi:hypothetical protein